MKSYHSNTVPPITMKIGMYMYFLWKRVFCNPLCCSSPPGGATVYQLLHRSINHQTANMVTKNDANLALSPTFRYVSIESGELKTHRAVELMHANSVDTQSLPVDMVWREVDISSLSFVCGSKLRGPLPIATLLFQREP
ncbi:UNVERIFIED_CONTAM: hypothetical protein NCL1_48001 [Trichonephila clavipes]